MRLQRSLTLSLSPLPSSPFARRTFASASNTKRSPASASDSTTMNTAKIFDKFLRIFLSTLTFVIAFYSTTLLMSYLYALDSALLGF